MDNCEVNLLCGMPKYLRTKRKHTKGTTNYQKSLAVPIVCNFHRTHILNSATTLAADFDKRLTMSNCRISVGIIGSCNCPKCQNANRSSRLYAGKCMEDGDGGNSST